MRFFLVVFFFALSVRADNVLFVGNSLTGVNNMPGVFLGLAQTQGLQPSVSVSLRFGGTLALQLADPKVRSFVTSKKWDSVVLQEYSDLPLRDFPSFEKSVREFVALVPGAHVYLFQNWPYSDADRSVISKLDRAYDGVAKTSGTTVVHLGRAMEYMRNRTEIGMYSDEKHPEPIATYMGALMFLDAIYGLAPGAFAARGSATNTPDAILGAASLPTWIDLNETDARLVQETAVRYK